MLPSLTNLPATPPIGVFANQQARAARAREPDYVLLTEDIFTNWCDEIRQSFNEEDPVVMQYLRGGAIPIPAPSAPGGFIGLVPVESFKVSPRHTRLSASLAAGQVASQLVRHIANGQWGAPTPWFFRIATLADRGQGTDPYHIVDVHNARVFDLTTSPRYYMTMYLEGLTDVPLKTMRIEELNPTTLDGVDAVDLRRAAAYAFRLCGDVDVLIDPSYWQSLREYYILGDAHGASSRFAALVDPDEGELSRSGDRNVAVPPNRPNSDIIIARMRPHTPEDAWLFYLSPRLVEAHEVLLQGHFNVAAEASNAATTRRTGQWRGGIAAIPKEVYLALPGGSDYAAVQAAPHAAFW
jgi:hypothetical protein